MPILDELKKLVAEQLEVEEGTVTPEASFVEDLGADSLDLVQLIMALEERWKIEIPDGDVERLVTVKDAITYLGERGVS